MQRQTDAAANTLPVYMDSSGAWHCSGSSQVRAVTSCVARKHSTIADCWRLKTEKNDEEDGKGCQEREEAPSAQSNALMLPFEKQTPVTIAAEATKNDALAVAASENASSAPCSASQSLLILQRARRNMSTLTSLLLHPKNRHASPRRLFRHI